MSQQTQARLNRMDAVLNRARLYDKELDRFIAQKSIQEELEYEEVTEMETLDALDAIELPKMADPAEEYAEVDIDELVASIDLDDILAQSDGLSL